MHVDVWVCVRIVVDLCGVLCAWQLSFSVRSPLIGSGDPPPRFGSQHGGESVGGNLRGCARPSADANEVG